MQPKLPIRNRMQREHPPSKMNLCQKKTHEKGAVGKRLGGKHARLAAKRSMCPVTFRRRNLTKQLLLIGPGSVRVGRGAARGVRSGKRRSVVFRRDGQKKSSNCRNCRRSATQLRRTFQVPRVIDRRFGRMFFSPAAREPSWALACTRSHRTQAARARRRRKRPTTTTLGRI